MKALAAALLAFGAVAGLWASSVTVDRQEATRASCEASGRYWYAGACSDVDPLRDEPAPSDLDSAMELMCGSLLPEDRATCRAKAGLP